MMVDVCDGLVLPCYQDMYRSVLRLFEAPCVPSMPDAGQCL
jgi:hypothetical protein